ncbi:hypothetical protein A21D_02877 [Virgibacillus dokdonensis]|uniref:Uncharacterized protein n=1 Tax=Virgibacillus dokdonensis TaxID=302167 RepID=A0A2K9J1U5_9BACI|nr:hypothetical protein A21D_02877 [Virgibacillus dokdonensis]
MKIDQHYLLANYSEFFYALGKDEFWCKQQLVLSINQVFNFLNR